MAGAMAAAAIAGTIVAAGAITGSVMANNAAKSATRAAMSKEERALAVWEDLKADLPDLQARRLVLDKLKSVGQYTPELEQAILTNDTELAKIAIPEKYKDAQDQALTGLQNVVDSGGVTPAERASEEELKADLGNTTKGIRERILQKAAERGTLSGGQVVAEQLQGAQGVSDQASLEAFKNKANARQMALDALEKEGNMATNLRTQDFGEQKSVADAQDTINKFNTSQSADSQTRNVQNKNNASQYNLNNDQRIADTNVGLENQETIYNLEQPNKVAQQKFDNEKSIASGQTNQFNQMAQTDQKAGQDTAAMWSGIGSGISKIGSAGLDYSLGSDATKKKAIT